MDHQFRGRVVIAALLALVIGAGIAVIAYNAGVEHAAISGGKVFAPPPPGTQYVYVRPWGFGFGFFPFLFILFGFFFIRSLFWRGRWYGGRGYRCGYHEHEREQTPPAQTQA